MVYLYLKLLLLCVFEKLCKRWNAWWFWWKGKLWLIKNEIFSKNLVETVYLNKNQNEDITNTNKRNEPIKFNNNKLEYKNNENNYNNQK